jgi:hypothetical protein
MQHEHSGERDDSHPGQNAAGTFKISSRYSEQLPWEQWRRSVVAQQCVALPMSFPSPYPIMQALYDSTSLQEGHGQYYKIY